MKRALLKSYLIYRYKFIVFWLLVIFLTGWFAPGDLLIDFVFPLIFLLREFYHYGEKLENIKKLRKKGLTEADLLNIEFVKKWEHSRIGGRWRYSLVYGLLIGGFGLSFAFSLIFGVVNSQRFKIILSQPEGMFRFILINYIGGAIAGVILFYVLWFFNERRFRRLTDPLNTIFSEKRISFNNPT
jgi:hypothetical protein